MKNNTLQYSLDHGQVITIILDRLFPDGFQIQVSRFTVDNVDSLRLLVKETYMCYHLFSAQK